MQEKNTVNSLSKNDASKETIILGVDPGYAIVGLGIISVKGNSLSPIFYSHISTSARQSFVDRLKIINIELKELIEKYSPNIVAIEKIFFSKNKKTAINVAQARGAILQECINAKCEIFEYTPIEVKLALTGYGGAVKSQIQQMVKNILGLKIIPKPDDTADALAIAICHNNSVKIKNL